MDSSKKPVNKLLILSEILICGLSGFFIGLLSTQYTDSTYILVAISGSGGMIGRKLLFIVVKNIFAGFLNISSVKDVDNDDGDIREQ